MARYIFIHWILLLIAQNNLQAGFRIRWPLSTQVSYAERIVVAKCIESAEYGQYKFLMRDIDSASGYYDTIITTMIHAEYILTKESIVEPSKLKIEQADEMVLFLTKTGYINHPWSVIFYYVSVDQKAYEPTYTSDDKAALAVIPEFKSWNDFKSRVKSIKMRYDALYALKNISNVKDRNSQLFQWLEKNSSKHQTYHCAHYEDCGWGYIEQRVLTWIVDGGNLNDAWKASQIFRELECQRFNKETCFAYDGIYQTNTVTFQNKKGILFLLEKAQNNSLPTVERNQALAFLSNAVRFLFEEPLDNLSKYIQIKDRALHSKTLEIIIPLLYQDSIAYFGFEVVKNLMHSEQNQNYAPVSMHLLPDLISMYKSLEYKPSDFRYSLASFLVDHVSIDEWESISGNPAYICVLLTHSNLESKPDYLVFHLASQNTDQVIQPEIKIYFERIVNGAQDSSFVIDSEKLYKPMNREYSTQSIRLYGQKFPEGTWSYYVTGTAGLNREYHWKSDKAIFVNRYLHK